MPLANIHNESFGYSDTCFGVWAAIGNPELVRYDPLTSSITRSGSVEVYRYNINSDAHDLRAVLHRPLSSAEDLLLATENLNILHTEFTGSVPLTADLDLLVDVGQYYTASEDGYGVAVDMFTTLLAVGCPYYTTTLTTTNSGSMVVTGNGQVDVYDVSTLDIDPYATRIAPTITGAGPDITGFYVVFASVPAGQNYSAILLQTRLSGSSDPWENVNIVRVANSGGSIGLRTGFNTFAQYVAHEFRLVPVVGTDPYLLTIDNPNPAITASFGYSVSINNGWLAVGSPLESGSKGAVFMYQQNSASVSWSLYQTLAVPADIGVGDNFGRSISLNKASGSFSGSVIVGSGKLSNSHAYVYEFNGATWNLKFTLNPDYTTDYPLTFYPTFPVFSGSFPNYSSSFGWSVSMYGDTAVVGSPTDRHILEYTGSSTYNQGSVYFFERCPRRDVGYYLARKSYGNEKTILDNRLGESVSVWADYAVVGSPKTNMYNMSICYLRGALFQQHYCTDLENQVQGQYILYKHITGSLPDTSNLDWGIVNVYQVKKRLLSPYRVYGFDTHVCEDFIVIGAPMLISGSQRVMDMNPQSGSFTGSLDNINDISGKAYIYNLKNLRDQFYVGNVFYRNGKMVVMSSGSSFDGLLTSTVPGEDYEYDMFFTSKQTLFEKQIVCPVDIGEFNVSTNPTAIVLPTSSYDINKNGTFDFQDCDVLLRYMMYKSTETTGHPSTNWSQSLISTNTDEEASVYTMYSGSWQGTDVLFTSAYSSINNSLFTELDYNQDNKIDSNDMNILWKYFISRLTQKNYETYITPNSTRKYLSDIIDFLNSRTMNGKPPMINPNFLDYARLSQADPTGSYLAPYVTQIGLFSGTELVAIAKLGSPIKIIPDFPFNFIVKIDF